MTDRPASAPSGEVELSVVLPAYNEPGLAEVVAEVSDLVERLVPGRGEVVVVDDASSDDTPQVLAASVAELPNVIAVRQAHNMGHGPALRRGFDQARGRWIGHLDTDDQVPVEELAALWAVKDHADLVLGNRTDRDDPRHRLALTAVVRRLVRALCGKPIPDANVPCKLVRRDLWHEAAAVMPRTAFAPSIGLVIVAARRGRRIEVVPIRHRARSRGQSTLRPVKLTRAVVRSTWETLSVARRA